MSTYENSGHIVKQPNHADTENTIVTREEGSGLQQAYGRTPKKPSPGIYHNTHLGQKDKATDHQELSAVTMTSPSTLNSANNKQLNQPLSGVYASLGQTDQDGVYQDLTTAASPSTLNSSSNRKLNQPSSGVYASLGQIDQDSVYQDLTTAASPSTLNSTSNRKLNQPSSGVYASLGQIDQDGVYQDLTTAASPSTLNSTSNRKPNQTLSGVYVSLGHIDQDNVYQDLDTVASPATPQQASNSKPEQPSSSGAYVNEQYRDQENACQEQVPQTIGPTVRYQFNEDTTSPKSCQILQQISGEFANVTVMVPKDEYKNVSSSITPSVEMGPPSDTNKLTPGPEVCQKNKAIDNQELSAVKTTSPSTLISTGNGQPKRPFSGVYASLGQRDRDSVYQDLDTVASPATLQQASNSKSEQPLSSGAYVNERYRDQENECQEQVPQTIGPTVRYHVNKDTPKSCQTLQQMSSECANVMVPKRCVQRCE